MRHSAAHDCSRRFTPTSITTARDDPRQAQRDRVEGLARGRRRGRRPTRCRPTGARGAVDLERRARRRRVRHPRRVLDQRLDRAERLGEREQPRARDDVERGVLAAAARNETMPPKSRIWRRATSWPGCRRARVEHPRDRVVLAQHLHDRRARSRSAAPCAPRASSRRAARGSSRTATAPRPSRSGGSAARRPSSASFDRDEPADDVGVAAEVLRASSAPTTSAPSASGCWRYGVANVLSTTTRASRACASSATAAMSTIDSVGLVGDSIQTRRVSSRHAAVERVGVAQVARGPRDAVPLVHARDEPERAAVRVGRDDHVVAGIERAQDRVLGREPAREREPVPRALERRDARLERGRASGCRCARTRSPGACRPRPARTSSRG